MHTPTVSVNMITYNHGRYIRRAIESVMMQVTTFDFQLVIGEDCSTDDTGAICQELADLHPNRIQLFRRPVNCGMHRNGRMTYDACRGEFIAFLEGDDVWTDVSKLQKQVDAMKANPDWSGCFHRCQLVKEGSTTVFGEVPASLGHEGCTLETIVRDNVIATSSILYRRDLLELPDWSYGLPMGDWPLWILLRLKGPLGFIDECMSLYRIHPGGVWSSMSNSKRAQSVLQFYDALDRHCPEVPRELLRDARNARIESLVEYASHLENQAAQYRVDLDKHLGSVGFRLERALRNPVGAVQRMWRRLFGNRQSVATT